MPQRAIVQSVAENLCRLARDFKSSDPGQVTELKKEFKLQSKNDIVRATVYLMEVIGSRDEQFKAIQAENADLKELLKLNNISIEGEDSAPSIEGSNGVAATGATEDTGVGRLGDNPNKGPGADSVGDGKEVTNGPA